jgi:hypothetical protein
VKTITLAAAKGGVGKTTLATALAVAAILETPDLRVGNAPFPDAKSPFRLFTMTGMSSPRLSPLTLGSWAGPVNSRRSGLHCRAVIVAACAAGKTVRCDGAITACILEAGPPPCPARRPVASRVVNQRWSERPSHSYAEQNPGGDGDFRA